MPDGIRREGYRMGRHSVQAEIESPGYQPSGPVELVPTYFTPPDNEAPVSPGPQTYTPSGIAAYAAGPHQPAAGPPRSPRRSWRPGRFLVIPLVLGLVGLGGVVGVDKYVKHKLCDQIDTIIKQSSASSASSSNDHTDHTDQADQADQADLGAFQRDVTALRTSAKFLVVDGELKRAVLGLTDDAVRWNTMSQKLKTASNDETLAMLPLIVTLAGSIDVHVRAAQRACGQPVTGVPVNS
jgi:hypothetical protein